MTKDRLKVVLNSLSAKDARECVGVLLRKCGEGDLEAVAKEAFEGWAPDLVAIQEKVIADVSPEKAEEKSEKKGKK